MSDTNTALDDANYRSPDNLAKAIMEFAKGPRLIGNFMGLLVYVDKSVPPGEIEIRHSDGRSQRFSIDQAEARRV